MTDEAARDKRSPCPAPPNESPDGRRPSRRRRFLFLALAAGMTYVVSELICLVGVLQVTGNASLQDLRERQWHLAKTGAGVEDAHETVHPYMGWSHNPQVSPGVTHGERTIPANRLGFVDDGPTILKKSPDRLIVGIAGGSVAWQLSVDGEDTLRERLATDPRYQGREVEIVRLAMSGFKQPQQVLALSWLLTLGAEFDVIVNIDGYNEAVLPICENVRASVNHAYPRAWHARTQDIVDPREYSISFELLQIRATRQRLAQNAVASWLRWSPAYSLIWYIRDTSIRERKIELATRLLAVYGEAVDDSFVNTGPTETFDSDDEMRAAVVDLWFRSSVQMQRMCKANGIRYVHVLQPNQYLPGSKPLTAEEDKDCHNPDMPESAAVRAVYPLMIASAADFSREGVQFTDLTGLFAETQQTIYADCWCHYNAEGNRMVANAIADALLKD